MTENNSTSGCGCTHALTLFVSDLVLILVHLYLSFIMLSLMDETATDMSNLSAWIATTSVLVLLVARYQRSAIAVFLRVKVAFWEWITVIGYLLGTALYILLPIRMTSVFYNPIVMYGVMLFVIPSILQSVLLSRYVRRSWMWFLANLPIYIALLFAAMFVSGFAQGLEETNGVGMSGIILIYVIPLAVIYVGITLTIHALLTSGTLQSIAVSRLDDANNDINSM